ncbi:MAG: hypothetical protein HC905_15930 [Bacteroidales bacterium]|nr:hypothetical protein [Bacteroidales bacterium]
MTPTLSEAHTSNGTGTGVFTSNMTGLTRNTKYYVRAYATNSEGTSYGDTLSFTTKGDLPIVTTSAVSSITIDEAQCGGNVTDDGGKPVTARGLCWSSTVPLPTLSDSYSEDGAGTGTSPVQ